MMVSEIRAITELYALKVEHLVPFLTKVSLCIYYTIMQKLCGWGQGTGGGGD